MSKQLLYLFGEPGTGKITVARILQERLGWKLFWLHDLDTICSIVGRYPLPRLMDRISQVVLNQLMDDRHNIIYVRPSRDGATVLQITDTAGKTGYRTHLFRLTASRQVLADRVSKRGQSRFRISSGVQLEDYLSARPDTSSWLAGVHSIDTSTLVAEEVADKIQSRLEEVDDDGRIHCHYRDRGEASGGATGDTNVQPPVGVGA